MLSPVSEGGSGMGSVDNGAGSGSGEGAAMIFGGGEGVSVGDRQGKGWALGVPSAGVREYSRGSMVPEGRRRRRER